MPEETEEGFTVRDRRRFRSDSEPVAETVAPEKVAEPTTLSATESVAEPAFFSSVEEEPFGEEAAMFSGESAEEYSEGMGYPDSMELPDIYAVLLEFLGILRSHAWLRMGLVPNPATGRVERDLSQAKVAIDTVGHLISQLEVVVAPEERLPLRALLSDLQIQFVEQSKKSL